MKREQQEKLIRIRIAQEFPGWTLEYIDHLSYADRENIFAVLNAQKLKAKRDKEKRDAEAAKWKKRRR